MNTPPPVYRPAAPVPSGMVQAGPGHISSLEKTEQPGKARAVQPRSMAFLGGRPAGFQTSSAVQRAQALNQNEPQVHPAMIAAAQSARQFANNWDTEDPQAAATACVNEAFRITSTARQEMENVPAEWRSDGKKDFAIAEVEKVIRNPSKQAIALLAAALIANQVLTEANNRYSGIVQVILSTKYEVDIPPAQDMIKRQKTFDPKKISRQYSQMYGFK